MLKKFLLVIAIGMMILALIDCKSGEDPAPDEKQTQLTKLTATWKCTSVMRDAIIQDGYANFQLTISGTPGADTFNYNTTGTPALSPWPASGTWSFGNNVNSDLLRDGSVAVSYTATGSELELTFLFTDKGFNARANIITGNWVFKFSK